MPPILAAVIKSKASLSKTEFKSYQPTNRFAPASIVNAPDTARVLKLLGLTPLIANAA